MQPKSLHFFLFFAVKTVFSCITVKYSRIYFIIISLTMTFVALNPKGTYLTPSRRAGLVLPER